MFTALKKKEENIAEYLLYMWQIEDLIRSCQFNIQEIEKKLITPTNFSNLQKKQLKDWYIDLMYQMESVDAQEKGHTAELNEIMEELEHVHSFMITIYQSDNYNELYKKCTPFIRELKKRSNNSLEHDIETCLEFMYGILLLRLQNKPIGGETIEVLKQISALVYELADRYKDYKTGFLSIPKVQKN